MAADALGESHTHVARRFLPSGAPVLVGMHRRRPSLRPHPPQTGSLSLLVRAEFANMDTHAVGIGNSMNRPRRARAQTSVSGMLQNSTRPVPVRPATSASSG